MQSAALKIWSQDIVNNVGKAQAMVFERAKDNGMAALGQWKRGG
jgi:fructose-bisphosphate aldolase class I